MQGKVYHGPGTQSSLSKGPIDALETRMLAGCEYFNKGSECSPRFSAKTISTEISPAPSLDAQPRFDDMELPVCASSDMVSCSSSASHYSL